MMSPTLFSRAVCLLATLFALVIAPVAWGHGFMDTPTPRQLCNGDENKFSVVVSGGNGGRGRTPPLGGGKHLCGDPFQSGKDLKTGKLKYAASNVKGMPCEPQEVYKAGGKISVRIAVNANHGGMFEFRVCDNPNSLSQSCFDKHVLKTSEFKTTDWHITTQSKKKTTQKDPEYYTISLDLPDGLTCDHCVLQWTWWTAHHCLPKKDCDPKVCKFYANGHNTIVRENTNWEMPECPSKWPSPGTKPQIFKNCADIAITASGSGGKKMASPTPADDEPMEAPDVEEDDTVEDDAMAETDGDEVEEDDDVGGMVSKGEKKRSYKPVKKSSKKSRGGKKGRKSKGSKKSRKGKKKGRKGKKKGKKGRGKRRSKNRGRKAKGRSRKSKSRSLLVADDDDVEEADSEDDVSAAGMFLTCQDYEVKQAFIKINKMRKEAGMPKLMCSNRASGVAENFSEIMCQQGKLMTDWMDEVDDCRLADFTYSGSCIQTVMKEKAGGLPDFKAMDWDEKAKLMGKHAEAGVGFSKCGDENYWTIILD